MFFQSNCKVVLFYFDELNCIVVLFYSRRFPIYLV